MKLFVDDIRRQPEGWHIARTNTEAIRLLATGSIEEISLDHDTVVQVELNGFKDWRVVSETFMPVAYYMALMSEKPKIRFHSGNIEMARLMCGIIGCKWDYWWTEDLDAVLP